jgi:hypothetical protein
MMVAVSRSYGLDVSLSKPLIFLLVLALLPASALYPLRIGKYGVSIVIGSLCLAGLGLISLMLLAGVGM